MADKSAPTHPQPRRSARSRQPKRPLEETDETEVKKAKPISTSINADAINDDDVPSSTPTVLPIDEIPEETPLECTRLRGFMTEADISFPFNMDGEVKLEVWTCGLRVVKHPNLTDTSSDTEAEDTHRHCAMNLTDAEKLSNDTKRLSTQMMSWKPSHNTCSEPWQAFMVWPKVIESLGIDLDGEHNIVEAARIILGLPTDGDHAIVSKPLLHNRKTLWASRFYFFDGRCHTKTLAKVKAATNYFWALTVKNSCVELKNHHPHSCYYGWGIVVVGRSKKVDGGLVFLCYTDGAEDHVYHGK
eukprot:m.72859 g.72859  ORF g.72859 m.72859 type:complete len:301 (-) comp24488_c1_seq1:39-941(-)